MAGHDESGIFIVSSNLKNDDEYVSANNYYQTSTPSTIASYRQQYTCLCLTQITQSSKGSQKYIRIIVCSTFKMGGGCLLNMVFIRSFNVLMISQSASHYFLDNSSIIYLNSWVLPMGQMQIVRACDQSLNNLNKLFQWASQKVLLISSAPYKID